MKLETNLKEKTQKYSTTQRLNKTLLNNEWVNNEIKKEIKKYLETNENEHTQPKTYEHSKSSPDREVQSNTGLPKKNRKNTNKQHNTTSTRTRGITTNPERAEERYNHIREDLNDIETKKSNSKD